MGDSKEEGSYVLTDAAASTSAGPSADPPAGPSTSAALSTDPPAGPSAGPPAGSSASAGPPAGPPAPAVLPAGPPTGSLAGPPAPAVPDQEDYLVIKAKSITPEIQQEIDKCLRTIPHVVVKLSQVIQGGTRKAKKDKKKRRKSHRFHKML